MVSLKLPSPGPALPPPPGHPSIFPPERLPRTQQDGARREPLPTSRRSLWCLLLSSSDLMRSRRAVPRSSSSSATDAVKATSRSRAWLNSKFCFSRSSCSSSIRPVSSSRDSEPPVSDQGPGYPAPLAHPRDSTPRADHSFASHLGVHRRVPLPSSRPQELAPDSDQTPSLSCAS